MWTLRLLAPVEILLLISHITVPTSTQNLLEISDTTTPELAEANGYKCETHFVTTEDGYIIGVHRLPGGRVQGLNSSLPPVMLSHALLGCSADWLIAGPTEALGYVLADLGYDVWMSNHRGNTYSKAHVFLSPDTRKFWEFSWHEMGVYDLPSVIDHILHTTQHQKLHYVGHSMGTTMFFVLTSTKPEYNDKILHMAALAPVAYVANIYTPVRVAIPALPLLSEFLIPFTHGEMAGRTCPGIEVLKHFCSLQINERMCQGIMELVAGFFDPIQFNVTLVPLIYRNDPAGTSFKVLLHYGQLVESRRFAEYDYGPEGNHELYGSSTPPSYNITQITAPMTLLYGLNDDLADGQDVLTLFDQLTNCRELVVVDSPFFNHVDFTYAKNVKTLVYDKVISAMKLFEHSNTSN